MESCHLIINEDKKITATRCCGDFVIIWEIVILRLRMGSRLGKADLQGVVC